MLKFQSYCAGVAHKIIGPTSHKIQYKLRRYRLMVRTPGFHPGNRGSIPRSATSETSITRKGVFDLVLLVRIWFSKILICGNGF